MQSEYQLTLPALDAKQAEPLARDRLEEASGKLGFVPNMYAALTNSPGLLDTCLHGYDRFRGQSGFTPAEQGMVLLAVSRETRRDRPGAGRATPDRLDRADRQPGLPPLPPFGATNPP